MDNTVKDKFEQYKKSLPKDSMCVIMQDAGDGMINFMSYDTTDKHDITTAYILLRGFMEMLETQIEYVITQGQSAIFKDLDIMVKPEVKNLASNKSNVTVVDFRNDK